MPTKLPLYASYKERRFHTAPYRADLSHTGNDEFVDEVVLSANFAEEEVDFLLAGNEAGADKSGI